MSRVKNRNGEFQWHTNLTDMKWHSRRLFLILLCMDLSSSFHLVVKDSCFKAVACLWSKALQKKRELCHLFLSLFNSHQLSFMSKATSCKNPSISVWAVYCELYHIERYSGISTPSYLYSVLLLLQGHVALLNTTAPKYKWSVAGWGSWCLFQEADHSVRGSEVAVTS